jgi:hypothetical protein
MVVLNTTAYTWDWYCHLVGERASLTSFLPQKISVDLFRAAPYMLLLVLHEDGLFNLFITKHTSVVVLQL